VDVAGTARAGGIGRALGEGLEILQRYTGDGGRQHVRAQLATNRHMIRFAVSELPHPFRLKTAVRAYSDALVRQQALFTRQRVDDITDAMRHAGASALVVDRLVQRGTKPSTAASFMRRLGEAHERDSELVGLHRAASEAMDLHNNELGIALALDHAGRGASARGAEQALEGVVLGALADGRGLVLDAPNLPPRASTAGDLVAVLRDPSRIGR
jgi:hypothetical protein